MKIVKMKSSLERTSIALFRWFFPYQKSRTLQEINISLAMFPRPQRPRHCIMFLITLTWCISASIRGFILGFINIPVLNELLCYSADAIGPIGQLSYLAGSFAFTEMLSLRFHVIRDYYTSFNNTPGFCHLLNLTDEETMKKSVIITKISNAIVGSLASFLFMHLVVMSTFDLTWGIFLAPFWWFITLCGPFFSSTEVNTMTCISGTNYNVIYKTGEELVQTVNRMCSHNHLDSRSFDHIISEYKRVLQLIQMFSVTSKMMMLLADLLCIPTYAVVLYGISIPVSSNREHYLKAVMLFTGSAYSLRGYVLVYTLAGLYEQSLRLHSALMSLSVRTKMKASEKKIILSILEDLCSTRTHWAIPEFGCNNVNRQDFLSSVLGTIQLSLLGYEFKRLFI